jgi:hypothetical protein
MKDLRTEFAKIIVFLKWAFIKVLTLIKDTKLQSGNFTICYLFAFIKMLAFQIEHP